MEMKNLKKTIPIGVVLLFIWASIPSYALHTTRHVETTSFNGNTLYVGGSGPGNYSKIQDAINAAGNGDTIFVFSGIYIEQIVIDKSINLVGEKKENTILTQLFFEEGAPPHNIDIMADDIVIKDFTIMGLYEITIYDIANICFENCIIKGRVIPQTGYFTISKSDNISLINNLFIRCGSNSHNTIQIFSSTNINILNNVILLNRGDVIYTYNCNKINISNNKIILTNMLNRIHLGFFEIYDAGLIDISFSNQTTISKNLIFLNRQGTIAIMFSDDIKIIKNDIIANPIPVKFSIFNTAKNVLFDGNFWNFPRSEKKIYGYKYDAEDINNKELIVLIDENPSSTPNTF